MLDQKHTLGRLDRTVGQHGFRSAPRQWNPVCLPIILWRLATNLTDVRRMTVVEVRGPPL
jgi:hypothetical protein